MEDYQPHLSARWLTAKLDEALTDTPVILLNGARQAGKSTLARGLVAARGGRYLTLDDPTLLAAAVSDPVSFVASSSGLTVIDEVQKAPGLFAAIKQQVDENRRPGRYLLTGSADVFLLPDAAESLAGRMEVLTLHPLARGEIEGGAPTFVERLFANNPSALLPKSSPPLAELLAGGGYPESLTRRTAARRRAWFDAYVQTITQRDIREWSNIADLAALPRLLNLIAVRSGGLLNVAGLARDSGVPQATLHRYLTLLEMSFLYQPLPAWHANLGKRLIKAPKTYLLDSGLACAVSGVDASSLAKAPHYGGLVESWVLGELRRECSALPTPPKVLHYRSAGGVEVDFILEDAQGQVAAVEVKASATLGDKHFNGLRDLSAGLGERLACGVVLYTGRERVQFGERLWALPMTAV